MKPRGCVRADGPFSSDTSNFHLYKCALSFYFISLPTHNKTDEITSVAEVARSPPPNIMGASDNNNTIKFIQRSCGRAVMSGCHARGRRMKKNGDTGRLRLERSGVFTFRRSAIFACVLFWPCRVRL